VDTARQPEEREVIRAAGVEVLDSSGQPLKVEPVREDPEPGTPVSWVVIGLCAAVFFLYNGSTGHPPTDFAYAPAAGQVFPQIITYMFLHGGLAHLLGNMLGVLFLGRLIEQVYGPWRYGAIYLIAGVLSAVAQAAVTPEVMLVGASGAVSAVMVCFIRHFPRALLYIYGIVPVPAWLVGILWVAYNLLGQRIPALGNIGFTAHLAGMVVGLVLSLLLVPPGRLKRREP
jgi:membrane associated rhomboid family serine protease